MLRETPLQTKELRSALLNELCRLNSLYQRMMSPSELSSAADEFARALAGETLGDIGRAFELHVRHSRRFPVPGDITALLPEARRPQVAQCSTRNFTRTRGFGQAIVAMYLNRVPCQGPDFCYRLLNALERDNVDPGNCDNETWLHYINKEMENGLRISERTR